MKKFAANPWGTMWTNPRSTIKAIIEFNPKYGFFYLASITFLQGFFFSLARHGVTLPINYFLSVIIAVILSPFLGALFLYITSFFLYFTGKWLNGKAPFSSILSSYSWSRIPLVIDLIMWVSLSVFITDPMFFRYESSISIFFVDLISIITAIWALVLLIACLKETQGFSTIRAISNVILAGLIPLIIAFVIFALILLLTRIF